MNSKLAWAQINLTKTTVLKMAIVGVFCLGTLTSHAQVSCHDLFKADISISILNESEYTFYAKNFAAGRQRQSGIRNFEKWDDSPKHLLRPAEEAAIYFYTYNPKYVLMNAILRRGDAEFNSDRTTYAAIRLAISGLKKLPNYEGPVYRGDVRSSRYYDEAVAKYTEGAVITESGFLSTSKGSCYACEFRNRPMVDIYITSKTGKDIQEISVNPSEREVLFLPGTRFRVDKVQNTGRLKVWMTEI